MTATTRSTRTRNRSNVTPIHKHHIRGRQSPGDSQTLPMMVDVSNIPDLSPLNKYAYEDTIEDLNSSPIKDLNSDDFRDESPIRQPLSSPIRKRKSVAFSDELFSDLPSSPDPRVTPKKSILKAFNLNLHSAQVDPNDTTLWNKSVNNASHGPANTDFWVQGTILQLPSNSPQLQQLVAGCIQVLKEETFDKRFEVYATLNNIYKTNSSETLLRLFTITSKAPSPKHNPGPKSLLSPLKQSLLSPGKMAPSPGKLSLLSPGKMVLSPLKMALNITSPLKMALSPLKQNILTIDESNYIIELSTLIKTEILAIEQELFSSDCDQENLQSKNNPFRIRVINQALKLMTFFMLDQELNNFLPLDEVKWFYRHACTVLVKVRNSKALVSPYLALIKDCRFNSKKKKILLDNTDIPEKMLFTLLNMQSFVSSSLVTEKFLCFKNFVANFPNIMAKNINHWFQVFLLNLCSLPSQLYAKCIGVGINCLLEIAKVFLDNKVVMAGVAHFLSCSVARDVRSISSDSSLDIDPESIESQKDLGIDYLILKVEEIIEVGQYKSAMEIWVAITLLVGDGGSKFENWTYLTRWLKIPKLCFDSTDINAKIVSVHSWRAIIYNVCHNDFDDLKKTIEPVMRQFRVKDRSQAISIALKQKVRLVTYLFVTIDINILQKEVIDSLHHLFLSILYSLLNPSSVKLNSKYLHIYWDKIIQPVMLNFYFRKDVSETYLNQLGVNILSRLMRTAMPINERNFNEMRCLASEPVSINEINSLPPRWVYAKFDRIVHNILMIFQLEKLSIDVKLNYFNTFLGCIKLTTKKEVQPSESTLDIIEYIPHVFDSLFKNNKLTFDMAFKLIINLHDTFNPSSLVHRFKLQDGTQSSLNVYTIIIENCISNLSPDHLRELLTLVVSSINDKKMLMVMFDLYKLLISAHNQDIQNLVLTVLNSRPIDKNEHELRLCGDMCSLLTTGFEVFVKKLIQSVVGNSSSEEIKKNLEYLKVPAWSIQAFKHFVLLVHDAPNPHIQEFTLKTISQRLEDEATFVEIIRYFNDNKYDSQLLALKEDILTRYNSLLNGFSKYDFAQVWRYYLDYKIETTIDFACIDSLLTSTLKLTDIDIKPYIRNNWENLPLLKETWLSMNGVLYIDENLVADSLADPKLAFQEEVQENEEEPIDISDGSVEVVEVVEDAVVVETVALPEISNEEIVDDSSNCMAIYTPPPFESLVETGPSGLVETGPSSLTETGPSTLTETGPSTLNKTSASELPALIEDVPRSRKSRKKSKSPDKIKSKSKKKLSKIKKDAEVEGNPVQEASFDIHSFTALLNAKLTVPEIKKSKKKKRADPKNKDTSKSVTKEATPIDAKVKKTRSSDKILKSPDIDDSIATDSLDSTNIESTIPSKHSDAAQKEISSPVDCEMIDESDSFGSNGIPTNTSSRHFVDYSQMLENGFLEQQNKLGSSSRRLKRKKTVTTLETPSKKQKIEDSLQLVPKEESMESKVPKSKKEALSKEISSKETSSKETLPSDQHIEIVGDSMEPSNESSTQEDTMDSVPNILCSPPQTTPKSPGSPEETVDVEHSNETSLQEHLEQVISPDVKIAEIFVNEGVEKVLEAEIEVDINEETVLQSDVVSESEPQETENDGKLDDLTASDLTEETNIINHSVEHQFSSIDDLQEYGNDNVVQESEEMVVKSDGEETLSVDANDTDERLEEVEDTTSNTHKGEDTTNTHKEEDITTNTHKEEDITTNTHKDQLSNNSHIEIDSTDSTEDSTTTNPKTEPNSISPTECVPTLSNLADQISRVSDHQIEKMTKAEIYRLETELMTFMYRIRNINS